MIACQYRPRVFAIGGDPCSSRLLQCAVHKSFIIALFLLLWSMTLLNSSTKERFNPVGSALLGNGGGELVAGVELRLKTSIRI